MKESLKWLAERVFAADRFATDTTGIVIASVEAHHVFCRLAIADRHRNARGGVMGGVLFTLADFGAAIAANTDCLVAGEELQWVSLGSTINFVAAAKGTALEAETVAVKHGHATALYRTTISDGTRVVAEVTSTMVKVPK